MRNRVKRKKKWKNKTNLSNRLIDTHHLLHIYYRDFVHVSFCTCTSIPCTSLSHSVYVRVWISMFVSCSISFLVWWILSDDNIFSVRIRKMDLKKVLPSYQTHEAKIPIDTNSKQIRYVYQKKWSALNVSCPNGTIHFMSIFIVKSANNNKIIANNWI